jgi:hypothetical protein
MAAKRRKTNVSLEMDDATRNPPGTCAVSGKRMYAHEGDAKAIAAHRMAEKESAPAKLTTYKCLYCGAWHLTSRQS